MSNEITEKVYPVEKIWPLKPLFWPIIVFIIASIPIILFSVLLFIFKSDQPEYDGEMLTKLLLGTLTFFAFSLFNFLDRKYFHYAVEDRFLRVKQGILSKNERHIPYEVIQNILVKQDLFDRLFKLSSLEIDNASQAGGALANNPQNKFFGLNIPHRESKDFEFIGFRDNKVNIPGLKKNNAEALKEIILQKMKENPIENNISGL